MFAFIRQLRDVWRDLNEQTAQAKVCKQLGHHYVGWRCTTCGRTEPSQDLGSPRQK